MRCTVLRVALATTCSLMAMSCVPVPFLGQVVCWDDWMGYRVQATLVDAKTGEGLPAVHAELRLIPDDWIGSGQSGAEGSVDLVAGKLLGGCGPIPLLPVLSSPAPELPNPGQIEIVVYPSQPDCEQRFLLDVDSEQLVETDRSESWVVLELVAPLLVNRCDDEPSGDTIAERAKDTIIEPADELELENADDGGTIAVTVGAHLTLTLAADHSTGYEWGIVELDKSILDHASRNYETTCDPHMPGCGGYETWVFVGRSPGTTILHLEYRRWWKSIDVEPPGTFRVTVTVTEETE